MATTDLIPYSKEELAKLISDDFIKSKSPEWFKMIAAELMPPDLNLVFNGNFDGETPKTKTMTLNYNKEELYPDNACTETNIVSPSYEIRGVSAAVIVEDEVEVVKPVNPNPNWGAY